MTEKTSARVARRWLMRTAKMEHGIAVYDGRTDPQLGHLLVRLVNSTNPADVKSVWHMTDDAFQKVRRGEPFLVEYFPDDQFLNYIPLSKLN